MGYVKSFTPRLIQSKFNAANAGSDYIPYTPIGYDKVT
jgi:hypothetical protein